MPTPFQTGPARARGFNLTGPRLAIATDQFLQEADGSLAIPGLCHHGFEHLSFVVHGAPQIMGLATDLHEYLVKVPTPLLAGPQSRGPLAPDFSRRHGAESVPPKAHGFMADINTALVEEIL